MVADADAGRLVRARIGIERLQGARRSVTERESRDHGHFDLLAARYTYLRTFTSAVIAHLPLTGNTANPDAAALRNAVEVLRGLNSSGRTTVPDDATTEAATSFVPTRWRGHLESTRGQGRAAAHRHYWELSVLYGVQAKLRSGDDIRSAAEGTPRGRGLTPRAARREPRTQRWGSTATLIASGAVAASSAREI